MPEIISFDDAIQKSEGNERSVLLGNGFSIQHFSYKSLLQKADLKASDPLSSLFRMLDTYDFETVMRAVCAENLVRVDEVGTMIALIWLVLGILASPFKSKYRLEADNAALGIR